MALEALPGRNESISGEEGLRQVFENGASIQLIVEGLAGRILEANPAASRFYGAARPQLTALSLWDLHAGPRDEAERVLALAARGAAGRLACRQRMASGETRDVEVEIGPLELGGRRLLHLVVHDVTQHRELEDALRRSEQKHREILASIEEGYYEVDLAGRFTFVNQAVCRALGLPQERLLGRSYRECLDTDNARAALAGFKRVFDTGQPAHQLEWRVRRPDGSDSHVAASAVLVHDAQGQRVGFRGILRDVTEHRQAEEALRRSEERYRQLVDLVPDAIAIHSGGRLVYLNRAGARLLGARQPEEILGRPVMDLVHPDSRTVVAQRMRQVAEGAHLPLMEEKFLRLDGSTVDLEAVAMPFEFEGRPGGLVVLRDVGQRRRAEQLQSALYRIAQVTASVADMQAFYAAMHAIVGELMYAANFYIALQDEATGMISFPYFVDEVDQVPPPLMPGKTLTEYVLRTGEPLLASPGVFQDLLLRGEVLPVGGPSVDWLGVPLKRGARSFGVLVVQSYNQEIRFSQADRDLLTFVSQHVASALDRKRAADALRESEAMFRTLAETAPCAILIFQGDRLAYGNEAMITISGYSREELLAQPLWAVVHPDYRDQVRERGLARERGETVPTRYELKLLRKDGEERWVDFSAANVEYRGQPAVLGTAFDITERKRAEEQIRSLAFQDALTGLPNRRLFNDRLHVAVAQAHRQNQRLAIFFLDLDRFKVINDSLGHSLGDELLCAVADRLHEAIREGDTVARLGGDEFILLLPGIARAVDLAKVAEKTLETLRRPFHLGERELFVSASIGISVYPEDGEEPEALVKNADTAMYRAKEQGRDTYQLYKRAMNATALERLALENSLRRALAQDELVVHYQPLLDIESGRVHGVEALLRWRHPDRGLVPPADFIPLAEVTGLILPMGPWLLRTACAQARRWHELGHTQLSIAINLSARQFQQPDLLAQVIGVLGETGLPPRLLELEITESSAMQNADATVQVLRELKALGVRISIDDFGIGHSSLGYLRRLPIDTLKIDKSFVRDIGSDPDDAAIVTAVIAMAHTLKLAVVAEGVETEEQLAFLAGRDCDRMQGYFFSHPLSAEECTELLERHRKP